MKIEKKNANNVFRFGDVKPGSVFKDKDGAVYMALHLEYGPRNAVALDTGCLALFDENEKVEILYDAVLTY